MYLLFLRTHSRKWPVDCWGAPGTLNVTVTILMLSIPALFDSIPQPAPQKLSQRFCCHVKQLFNYPTFLTINERLTIKYGYMTTHCAVCVLIPCCVTIHYWPRVKLSSEYPSIFWPLYSLIPQLWPQQHNILFCRCWGSMCWCQVVTAAGSPRSSSWHGARLATTLQPFNQTCCC